MDRTVEFVLRSSTEDALSLIEATFRLLPRDSSYYLQECVADKYEPAIAELNARFRMHGIGYEFVNNDLIRVDSQFLHAETVKPALMLLADKKFHGAEKEFTQAHEHFRKGKYEDALTWALKAFESAMKTICDDRRITYDHQKATAKQLIEKMFANKVIPATLESEFTGLRSVLESGSPTMRNRFGGHGQGATPRNIPQHFAAYALHMAASNIVFLVQCHNS